jgi:hypothetical protein
MSETPIVYTTIYNNMAVVPTSHVLAVHSLPMTGVPFTVDGTNHSTDWSGALNTGSYTVTMPSSIVSGGETYNFLKWENGNTNRIRIVNLTIDMTITATYAVYVPPITGEGANTFGEQWGFWVWSVQAKRWYDAGNPVG